MSQSAVVGSMLDTGTTVSSFTHPSDEEEEEDEEEEDDETTGQYKLQTCIYLSKVGFYISNFTKNENHQKCHVFDVIKFHMFLK